MVRWRESFNDGVANTAIATPASPYLPIPLSPHLPNREVLEHHAIENSDRTISNKLRRLVLPTRINPPQLLAVASAE